MATEPKSELRSPSAPPVEALSGYQKFVIAILAFLQFTIILDFMILSPLGAVLMPALNASAAQFGFVVSAYAFSAGFSGLLAAGFADRFDRKKLLLFFYAGFVLGTFLCGIAQTYEFLVFARIVTGLFGGVIGSIVFAITTDLFSFSQRGRVMGVVQTAFAASQILGIPVGLKLSNHFVDWHAPFMMIVTVSLAVGVVIVVYLKPINAHLKIASTRSPFRHLAHTVSQPRYLQGFLTTALLSTGGFMLMPFGSAFSVNNLKIALVDLPTVYFATGIFSMITGPLIGRLADRIGKFRVFTAGSALSIIMVFIYTRLGPTPIWEVVLVSAVMFMGISGRMISASALMSAIPAPADRGSYMSVSSSLQQISGGIAAALAGFLVVQPPGEPLRGFDSIGDVVMITTAITIALMYLIHRYLLKVATAAQAFNQSGR